MRNSPYKSAEYINLKLKTLVAYHLIDAFLLMTT